MQNYKNFINLYKSNPLKYKDMVITKLKNNFSNKSNFIRLINFLKIISTIEKQQGIFRTSIMASKLYQIGFDWKTSMKIANLL
jgi:hypothetical protein